MCWIVTALSPFVVHFRDPYPVTLNNWILLQIPTRLSPLFLCGPIKRRLSDDVTSGRTVDYWINVKRSCRCLNDWLITDKSCDFNGKIVSDSGPREISRPIPGPVKYRVTSPRRGLIELGNRNQRQVNRTRVLYY